MEMIKFAVPKELFDTTVRNIKRLIEQDPDLAIDYTDEDLAKAVLSIMAISLDDFVYTSALYEDLPSLMRVHKTAQSLSKKEVAA